MSHVMLDLETLGLRAGCRVLSIGAVEFSRRGLGAEFYTVLNADDQDRLFIDPDTVAWWNRQAKEARRVFTDPKVPTPEGLASFNAYCASIASVRDLRVWGCGADFDQPILAAVYAMQAPDLKLPWQWGSRCYRTLKNLRKDVVMARQGTYHNALDDAKSQALHAIQLLNTMQAW